MANIDHDPERLMQRREDVLHTVFELNPYPMWVFDSVTLRFLVVNQVAIRTYGFLRTVADMLPVEISNIDVHQRFVFANEAYRLQYADGAAEVVGRHTREVLGEERYAQRAPYIERAMSGEHVIFQEEHGEGDDYRCVESTFTPELDEDGVSVIGMHAMMQDVSSKKREERRLTRLARIDSLTGLLNRAGFYERLEHAIERSRD